MTSPSARVGALREIKHDGAPVEPQSRRRRGVEHPAEIALAQSLQRERDRPDPLGEFPPFRDEPVGHLGAWLRTATRRAPEESVLRAGR